jgi:hypothetical protein
MKSEDKSVVVHSLIVALTKKLSVVKEEKSSNYQYVSKKFFLTV